MDESRALLLLENKLSGVFERDDATELLDCMPLTISQAAAYVKGHPSDYGGQISTWFFSQKRSQPRKSSQQGCRRPS